MTSTAADFFLSCMLYCIAVLQWFVYRLIVKVGVHAVWFQFPAILGLAVKSFI